MDILGNDTSRIRANGGVATIKHQTSIADAGGYKFECILKEDNPLGIDNLIGIDKALTPWKPFNIAVLHSPTDLTIEIVEQVTPVVGKPITVPVRVTNNGGMTSGAYKIDFFVWQVVKSTDDYEGSSDGQSQVSYVETGRESVSRGSLGAGQSTEFDFESTTIGANLQIGENLLCVRIEEDTPLVQPVESVRAKCDRVYVLPDMGEDFPGEMQVFWHRDDKFQLALELDVDFSNIVNEFSPFPLLAIIGGVVDTVESTIQNVQEMEPGTIPAVPLGLVGGIFQIQGTWDYGSEPFWVFVPTEYTNGETREVAKEIVERTWGGTEHRDDRKKAYLKLALEIARRGQTYGDHLFFTPLKQKAALDSVIELTADVKVSAEYSEIATIFLDEIAKAHQIDIPVNLDHLHTNLHHLGGALKGVSLGTKAVQVLNDIKFTESFNRTIDLSEAEQTLRILKQLPIQDVAWNDAIIEAETRLAEMTSPEGLERWSAAVEENIPNMVEVFSQVAVTFAAQQAVTMVAGGAIVAVAGVVGAPVLVIAIPVSIAVGVTIDEIYGIVEENERFWDGVTLASMTAQIYTALFSELNEINSSSKDRKAMEQISDYLEFSYFKHLARAGEANPEFFSVDLGVWGDGRETHESLVEELDSIAFERDERLSEALHSSWDHTKDFKYLKGAKKPLDIWSDETTMWVIDGQTTDDHLIYAFNMATKEEDTGKKIQARTELLVLQVNPVGSVLYEIFKDGAPKGLWSNDGSILLVADHSSATEVYAYNLPPNEWYQSNNFGIGPRALSEGFDLPSEDEFYNLPDGGMWSDGTTIWFASFGECKIIAYDIALGARDTDKQLCKLAAENDHPYGLWSDGATMWVSDAVDGHIYAYSIRFSGLELGEPVPGQREIGREIVTVKVRDIGEKDRPKIADNSTPMGIWSDGETMWVADAESDRIFAYTIPEDDGSAVPVPVLEEPCVDDSAVPSPQSNPLLVADCQTLLLLMDTLSGNAAPLDWSTSRPIPQWEGVVLNRNGTRVTGLLLSGSGLNGSIPSALDELTLLESLDLSNNQLTGGIPAGLSELSSLRTLNLRNNSLTGTIPASLSSLPSLQALDLRDNNFEGPIPSQLQRLGDTLQSLYLGGNSRLPECLPNWMYLIPTNDLLSRDIMRCHEGPATVDWATEGLTVSPPALETQGGDLVARVVTTEGIVPATAPYFSIPDLDEHDVTGGICSADPPAGLSPEEKCWEAKFSIPGNDTDTAKDYTVDVYSDQVATTLQAQVSVAPLLDEPPESNCLQDMICYTSSPVLHSETKAAIREEFGEDWVIADWSDVKDLWPLHQEEMKTFFENSVRVRVDGNEQWGTTGRWYFIQDNDGSKPGYFLAHDELGGHELSLGSWFFEESTPLAIRSEDTNGPLQDSRVLLNGGTLNGQSINSANPTLIVAPGEAITGSVKLTVHNDHAASALFPVEATPTWGDHESSYWDVPLSVPAYGSVQGDASVDLTAPDTPGEYAVIFVAQAEFYNGFVASATHWFSGRQQWNNGDDVAGWDDDTIDFAIANGYVRAPQHGWSQPLAHFSAAAIKVVVTAGTGGDSGLRAHGMSVSDNNPDVGEQITLNATVTNDWDGNAATTTLRFYHSTDSSITRDDTEVGSFSVSALAPGESVSDSITLNSHPFAGSHYYGACADSVSGDTDSSNDCTGSASITVSKVTKCLNDTLCYVNTPFVPSQAAASIRQEFGEDWEIADWNDVKELWSDHEQELKSFLTNAYIRVTVDGNEQWGSSGRWYFIEDHNGSRPGFFLAHDELGGNELSLGSWFADEWLVLAIKTSEEGPDLVVESVTASESSVDPEGSFTLSATVRNQGNEDASSTTLRFYHSTDSSITRDDTEVGSFSVSALAPGESVSDSMTLNSHPFAGSHYYGACADSVSGDTDSSNDCTGSASITVSKVTKCLNDTLCYVNTPFVPSQAAASIRQEFGEDWEIADWNDVKELWSDHEQELKSFLPNAYIRVTVDGNEQWGSSGRWYFIEDHNGSRPGFFLVHDELGGNELSLGSWFADEWLVLAIKTSEEGPDLVVESVTASESSVDPEGSFTLSATVRNQGDSEATYTTLRYYRSADSAIDTSDTEVATSDLRRLDEDETDNESEQVDASGEAGTYYFGACVDSVSNESNTQNNCSSGVTVTVLPVDLVVAAVSVSESSLKLNDYFELSATVQNQGTGESASTTLRYYRSTDSTISTSDTEENTDNVGSLDPFQTGNESEDIDAPSSAGTYYYGVCVDSVPGESNTQNNCSDGVRVTITEGSPDLFAFRASVSDNSLAEGEAFTLSVGVENVGSSDAEASTLSYYRSTDSSISTSDTRVGGTDSVGSLAVGEIENFSESLTTPDSTGTYYFGACVDPVPGESNTQDNCTWAAVAIGVGDVSPDLEVYSRSVYEWTLDPGERFNTGFMVRNQGTGPSPIGNAALRYYRSTDSTISAGDTELFGDWATGIGTMPPSASKTIVYEIEVHSSGTFYYGACVEIVEGDSNTGNNCGAVLKVTAN